MSINVKIFAATRPSTVTDRRDKHYYVKGQKITHSVTTWLVRTKQGDRVPDLWSLVLEAAAVPRQLEKQECAAPERTCQGRRGG